MGFLFTWVNRMPWKSIGLEPATGWRSMMTLGRGMHRKLGLMDARGHFGCCVGTFPDLELGRFQVEMSMIC